VSGMGSVERVLVLGIVVVIVAILGITIWGAAGEEPGAVLPATDGGVVSLAPGNTDGAPGLLPDATAPLADAGTEGTTPVSAIDQWRALNQREAEARGVPLGNEPPAPAASLTADAGAPAPLAGPVAPGAVALESNVNVLPVSAAPASVPVVGPSKPATSASAPGMHTVVSGDSIWKIAHRTYGDANIQEHIDAILAANPSVDADNLKVGAKLTLPAADGSDIARQPAAKQVTALSGSLYEVKKGDTLSSIARAQLGNASKWKSIYELNRERIADPASIKAGTTLRLPKS
jgi:nucleoid-associated protein YgaU